MKLRNLLIAAAGLSVSIAAAGAASAHETVWQYTHPARTEVNHRRGNLNERITEERREGDITRLQALRERDRLNQVRYQERIFARHHGGRLNAAEVERLNREENIARNNLPG